MRDKFFHIHFRPDEGGGSGSSGDGGDGGSGSGSQSTEGQVPASTGQAVGGDARDRELAEARQEAARYRTERNNLSKRLEALEGAGKTEAQKKDEKIVELEKNLSRKDAAVNALRARVLAPQAGISDPKAAADAASLLDWSQVEDPENDSSIVKALKELVKDRQYLSGNIAGGADGGEGSGSRQAGESGHDEMNRRLREAAGRG